MDFDVIIETLRAVVTALILAYLWRAGKREHLQQQKGWQAIIIGFSLILFASLLDITDNFPSLNHFVVIGKTHTESFLEKMVGYLGGFIVLFMGLVRWIPLIIKLRSTEAALQKKTAELELKVIERTTELQLKNQILEHEMLMLAEAEEKIRQLAFYDTLTLLPNRRLLGDRLTQSIATSKRHHRYAAIMFLDMDNFKQLNDTHGHHAGDSLLIEVARRITECTRAIDTVARLGGDEFVVLLNELDVDSAASQRQASTVAEKIRAVLAEPYKLQISQEDETLKTIEQQCSASVGVVLFNHATNPEEILKRADSAMYLAKNAGRNLVQFYT